MNLRLFKHHITTGYYDTALWQSNETHLVGEWIRVQQDLIITDNINLVFEAKKIGELARPFSANTAHSLFCNQKFLTYIQTLQVLLQSMTSH